MTSATGSVSFNGSQLLGGTAGKIDTDALIDALMAAKSIPQKQLQDRLAKQQTLNDNVQEMNRRMQAITTAAMSLTDLSFDGVPTKASSSLTSVLASSTSGAIAGSATFHVDQVAAAQVSTVKADGSGSFVSDYTAGIDLAVGGGASVHLALKSGSAADIASAVNTAGLGVRAAVVNVDDPANPGSTTQVLQFTAAKTGVANNFSITGLAQNVTGGDPATDTTTVTAARDARISVGDPNAGGYTISSATNTFTGAMPGVTFTVSAAAVGSDVSITVGDDVSALSDKMQALIDAINSAKGGIKTLTVKGGLFQGDSTMNGIGFDLANAISSGTVGGKSLSDFGIDMDKDGVVSFNASTFAAAYQSDAAGTLAAVGSGGFATAMRQVSEAASTPVVGSLAVALASDQQKVDDHNTQISKWDDRLAKEHDQLVLKYTAMQTAMAKLQSTGDWLTNMFKSITDSQKDN
jgi:flagellar hook-associated protein 2